MKFLCDRCKTRYSIGDERVRGKILKIRCKNCNNVITVREGMPEIGADEGRRRNQPTQAIEAVSAANAGSGGNGALGAAFASAMAKPPPALEEEWYVSIEGDQSGPFSLADAQRWVASKSPDADLHCWSEGFDDWLPVDKVSHFRGLRKKAALPSLSSPPPLPRAATSAQRAVSRTPAPVEEEPKPLFAATMASLEKATQPPLGSGNFGLPPLASPATPAPTPLPSPSAPSSRGTPLGGQPAMPLGARTNGSAAVKTPLPSVSSGRATIQPADPADSATQIESPPFGDDARTTAEPVASQASDAFSRAQRDKKSDPFANKADPFAQTTPQSAKADPFGARPAPAALDLTQQVGDHDVDGDLDIGEVSRVVKLADIVKQPSKSERAQPAARTPTVAPAVGRSTQPNLAALSRTSSISLNRTGSAASIPVLGPDGKQIDPSTGEPIPLAPQVAVSHRRGMIALLVGALVLLGGAAAAVIYIVTSRETSSGGGLVGYDVDTTRPDDPRRKQGSAGVAPVDDKQPSNPFVPKPRPRPTQPQIPVAPTNPNVRDLRPDEVEEMAGKYSGSTQTCWRRSQRGAEAILLSDLKKLGVTLVVDKSGVVTSVSLSDHSTTSLGKCLMSSIKSWKFRESTAGITARITLVFQGV